MITRAIRQLHYKSKPPERLYLYNYGDECVDVTGGWVVDENSTSDGTYPYKGEDGLYLHYTNMGWPGSCFITNNIIPILSYSKIGCVFRIYKTYSRYQCLAFTDGERINTNTSRPRYQVYCYLATSTNPDSDIGYVYGNLNAWSDDITLYTNTWDWTSNVKLGVNMWGGDSGSGYLHIKQLWLE